VAVTSETGTTESLSIRSATGPDVEEGSLGGRPPGAAAAAPGQAADPCRGEQRGDSGANDLWLTGLS